MSTADTLAAAQAAAIRAAVLARLAAGNGGSSGASASAAASTPGAAAAQPGASAPLAAPAPPAEDAVQDGGDAIDTFSSYVPTALPPCIAQALRDRERFGAQDVAAAAACASVGGNSSAGSTTGSTTKESEVINLLDNDDSNLPEAAASSSSISLHVGAAASTARAASAATDDDSVIEILDTDNEDSRLGMASSPHDANTIDVDIPNGSNNASNDNDVSSISSTNDNIVATNANASLFHPTSGIPSHTSPAVESALLSSVSAPPVPNEAAATVLELVLSGKLSPLQAEGVTLAINRFNRVFTPNGTGKSNAGTRAGFFLGDGAGVGKGRQISATIRDALCRNHGRGRHLWISVSRELVQDARRDLADVGCHVDVHDGADVLDQMSTAGGSGKKGKGLGAGGSLGKGVLFITYSLLVSGKRVEDIVNWLAGDDSSSSSVSTASRKTSDNAAIDRAQQAQLLKEKRAEIERSYTGLIVFDEAHKAKNLESDTRTAKLVLALQERLPNARVLYCSATGVSDVSSCDLSCALMLLSCFEVRPMYITYLSTSSQHVCHTS